MNWSEVGVNGNRQRGLVQRVGAWGGASWVFVLFSLRRIARGGLVHQQDCVLLFARGTFWSDLVSRFPVAVFFLLSMAAIWSRIHRSPPNRC